MRRPVKPFVTEYKGSARRGKEGRADVDDVKPRAPEERPDGGGRGAGRGGGRAAAKRDATAEGRGAQPPRGAFRNSAGEDEAINSYEAAMRAADALFSPKAKAEAAPADASTPARSASKPASRAAPGSAEQPAAEPAQPDATIPGQSDAAAGQTEPTGRVLRALDEPEPAPPEPMPEPAPRRRGRKPGSVNKVRTPDAARRRLPRAAASHSTAPEAGAPAAGTADATLTPMAGATPDAHEAEAPVPHPSADMSRDRGAGESRPGVKRQRERFSWIRTKLGPGEKWKRRLPKVAW